MRPRGDALERHGLAALFLTPGVLLFTLFVMLPMIEAAWYSFYRWDGYGTPTNYVGLRNYLTLFGNSVFHSAMWNTAAVVLVSLLIQLPLALGLAFLIAERFPGSYLFRTIFFLPYILGEVVAGLIWRFVFDGNFGLAAQVSRWLGVEQFYILADPNLALMAIMVVVIWKYFGFHMMIYIAGLQDIPRELREAAAIDGASRWQRFRHVTLPMITPTIFFNLVLGIIGALQVFTSAYVATAGGPAYATWFYAVNIYYQAFQYFNMGYAAALSWLFAVLIITLTWFQFRVSRSWVYYAGGE